MSRKEWYNAEVNAQMNITARQKAEAEKERKECRNATIAVIVMTVMFPVMYGIFGALD